MTSTKISGHWDHYKDGMFVLGDEETDKEVFALRPMTCPFQYYVYKAEQHSYRDLPLRYGETSTLFRNEDSGEMHGLTRVRQFTISEGHLIVRPDQMVKEFKDCIALAQYCLQVLGVEEDVTYHLSNGIRTTERNTSVMQKCGIRQKLISARCLKN